MRSKKSFISLLCIIVWIGVVSCTSQQSLIPAISVSHSTEILQPDKENCISVDCKFNIPSEGFSKRSRLLVTPQLMSGDTVRAQYEPLILDAPVYAKKNQRRIQLEGYNDPYANRAMELLYDRLVYSISYRKLLTLPLDVADGDRLVAIVSTEKCLNCTAVDTLPIAILQLRTLPVVAVTWMNPSFVVKPKLIEGKGEAHLRFAMNDSYIDSNMGNNQKELDSLRYRLAPVLQDSLAQIHEIKITGMASADGSHAFNLSLAHKRAESARNWLITIFGLQNEIAQKITVNARPEGWYPVLHQMEEVHHPGATSVRQILEKYASYEEDKQEQQIRRLSCWSDICKHFLATDRKVAYTYQYSLRSFTSESELITMYRTRPDAFNEQELLRVAQLMNSESEQQEVYEQVIRLYPQSEVALNNLAILCLRRGDEKAARGWLERLPAWCEQWAGKDIKLEEKR